jgi:hypothetical protein
MNIKHKIIEVNTSDLLNYGGDIHSWDGISKIKIIQYDSIETYVFWLESIKNWNYKKNARWLNEKAMIALKWLKKNYPEYLI